MRSVLTRVRAKVDFPVPLEPVIMMMGGTVDEKEDGMTSICFANPSKQDLHGCGTDSVGTL